MDVSSAMFLLLLGVLCLGPAPSWARPQFHDSTTQDPQRGPHLTGCHSPEQETFTCWWTPGSWKNMSEPGDLRFFYTVQLPKEKPPQPREWHECPQYSASRPYECHFSRNYTHVWVPYCVELRSVERNVTYDWNCFSVENIVQPDPPINLNWTLLNISRSGLLFDIMVRWEPPPSAAIAMGWISLTYQIQYRLVNSSHWDVIEQDSGTHQPIYSLQTDKTYEVRVRGRMRTFREFGEFTDTIIVRVDDILSKDATFPMTMVMVFGVVGMVILLMLIIFTQQQRLMVILLPPVPAPKIKGIDNELLKKGKLDDLNLILSSGHMMYKPDMFPDESWVEFIELDVDDAEHDPADKADASDTQHLLGGGDVGGRHGHRHGCLGSSHALSLKDDDSGRASCYDPELPMEALLTAALLPQSEQAKLGRVGAREGGGGSGGDDDPVSHTDSANSTNPSPGGGTPTSGIGTPEHPGGQPQQHGQPQIVTGGGVSGPNWATMDFYAQVSDVTPAGGVVLSPGSLLASQTSSSSSSVPDKNKKNSEKDQEMNEEEEDKRRIEEKEKEKKEVEGGMTPKFHLLVVNPDGGYASESVAKDPVIEPPQQMVPGGYTTSPVPMLPPQDEHPPGVDPAACPASPTTTTTTTTTTTPGGYQSPYCLPDAMPAFMPSSMPPMSDYTVVQDVDAQHSLLLNAAAPTPPPPTHHQSPPPASGKHLPAMPAMPMGYLTPELMGNLMP